MRDVDSSNPIRSGMSTGSATDSVDEVGEADGVVPDFPAAREHVLTELIGFAIRLRAEGSSVPPTASIDAARSLAVVGLSDRDRVADALRASMLSDPRDIDPFEEYFPAFWHRLRNGLEGIATGSDSSVAPEVDGEPAIDEIDEDDEGRILGSEDDPQMEQRGGEDDGTGVRIGTDRRHASGESPAETGDRAARRYSPSGSSEKVDALAVALEQDEIAAVDRFATAIATLPGRRHRPGGSHVVDARRALRASLATGGAPMALPKRERVAGELRYCLLLDVSGSVLDTIDRNTVLAFAERLQSAARTGHVFAFDDGFADVTAHFERAEGDPAAAMHEAEIEWGGGTKIGAALETLRNRHPHSVDRRTVVVVLSDGLDVGDAEALERGITWLAGRAGAIVWLNPLAVSPAYEPRSRGMATCLPYVDGLFAFASAADLEEAATQLERRGFVGTVGYEHDPRRLSDRGRTTSTGMGMSDE